MTKNKLQGTIESFEAIGAHETSEDMAMLLSAARKYAALEPMLRKFIQDVEVYECDYESRAERTEKFAARIKSVIEGE